MTGSLPESARATLRNVTSCRRACASPRQPPTSPPPPRSGAPMLVPWLGTVPCFHTAKRRPTSAQNHRQPVNSQQYTADYNEVKALGAQVKPSPVPQRQGDLALTSMLEIWNNFVLLRRALRDVAPRTSIISAIMRDCWRWPIWRWPMQSSPFETARSTMFCGDRSRPSKRARTTAMRRRLVTPLGSRF